jgi:hypothetical protein
MGPRITQSNQINFKSEEIIVRDKQISETIQIKMKIKRIRKLRK